jgi:hypothetical protein
MTPVTLVTGARAAARESAIKRAIDREIAASPAGKDSIAVILEGLPDGSGLLENHPPDLQLAQLVRIAPGCVCCTGNVVLRVTLNRILRHPPAHLYIGLADITHLDRIRQFLRDPPYDQLLTLTGDLPA